MDLLLHWAYYLSYDENTAALKVSRPSHSDLQYRSVIFTASKDSQIHSTVLICISLSTDMEVPAAKEGDRLAVWSGGSPLRHQIPSGYRGGIIQRWLHSR